MTDGSRAQPHPRSGNARLSAARLRVVEALERATDGKAVVDIEHLRFLLGATDYISLGDSDPAEEPMTKAIAAAAQERSEP